MFSHDGLSDKRVRTGAKEYQGPPLLLLPQPHVAYLECPVRPVEVIIIASSFLSHTCIYVSHMHLRIRCYCIKIMLTLTSLAHAFFSYSLGIKLCSCNLT